MKKVGFIGAYDKTHMILSIAKILTAKYKKPIIIDTTIEQKTKYIVPTIHPTEKYITTWEDIDVAVGFKNIEEICQYAGIEKLENEYDIILMNIDSANELNELNVLKNDANYFVTAVDLYSIRKGIEIFSNLKENINIGRIIFSREMDSSEKEYIDYSIQDYPINWVGDVIFFPLTLEDRYVEMDSQMIYKINFKSISQLYKDSLAHLISTAFADEINENTARKIIKTLEKDGI